jgi:hypothetical protein
VDGGQFHEASAEEGRHVEDTDCPAWRTQNAGDDLLGPEELDHQYDGVPEGDQVLIDLLLAPDEECLDEFFALMEKYPDLVDFFAEMKRRTAAGQSLFRPVGLDPEASDLLTPVLSPSLADGPDGQEVVGLKLTVGGRILEDTAGYRRDQGKLDAALNIISLYMIHIDYDFPYNIADCYEIILIFKYLSYIISRYSLIINKQQGDKFIVN